MEEDMENDAKKETNFCEDHNFYIYGEFDESIATNIIPKFIKQIEEKKRIKEGKITFYISSNGGYAYILQSLLSLFERAKKEGIIVETHVYANAYSCGSLLACAGTKGHRYIGEYAEHLCHLGAAGMYVTNDVQHERESQRVRAHFDFVRSTYKKYASIKGLDKVIHDDSYFIRGKDIIANGLADKMI
jgi:ATP-dependent protease ClpP protease subunit